MINGSPKRRRQYILYMYMRHLKVLTVHSNWEERLGSFHKVRTYKEYHSVCPSSELGLSQPLSRQRGFPSPQKQGGGVTLPCVWGVGGSPNSDEGHTLWYSLYVRTLWLIRSVMTNWRLGNFFQSHFKWPSSQDQQKTNSHRLVTFKVTLTGQSHLMLIFWLRKVKLRGRTVQYSRQRPTP